MFIIRASRIRGSRPKRFHADGWLHYNVKVFIEPDNKSTLEAVQMVVYVLHPSFNERYRVSVDRKGKFQIQIWSYDFFDASAEVLLKDGTYQTVNGEVRWEGSTEVEEYS